MPPGFDPSIFGSLPPHTPTTPSSHHSNINDFSAAIASGTSKAAAQVATFMSQAPPLEIHNALAQNPQLALILNQAFASMSQALEPNRNHHMGLSDTVRNTFLATSKLFHNYYSEANAIPCP